MATSNRQKESNEQVGGEEEEEEEEDVEEEHEPQLLPNGIREVNNKRVVLSLHD